MPNSNSGRFFNRRQIQYEYDALNTEFSKIFFFFFLFFVLPSVTDRIDKINRYMGSVNLIPIDSSEDRFHVEGGIAFDRSNLDYNNPDKEKMRQALLKALRKVVNLPNANIIKNANGLMSKKSIDEDVEWVGKLVNVCLKIDSKCFTDLVL